MIENPIYRFSALIKKGFEDGRGTITLTCFDVLRSDRITQTEITQNINSVFTLYRDSSVVNLKLLWKLGKSQYQREEKKKSAEDEINHVGKGAVNSKRK